MSDASDASRAPPATAAASSLLVEGDTCWRKVVAERAAVIVDGADYFAALRAALLAAERSVFILGWEMNSRMPLRGVAKPRDRAPLELGKFLCHIARRRPTLEIRILLWDYTVFYAPAREFFPRLSLGWRTPGCIEIRLDDRLPLGASHHEKLVVVDDRIAFCGGMDLTVGRWDTPQHLPGDRRRRVPGRKPRHSVHDVQLLVDGPAAAALGAHVRTRWEQATGTRPDPAPGIRDPWPRDLAANLERVPCGIARTQAATAAGSEIREVERSTVAALTRAERFVYIENQYITAKAAAEALLAQMRAKPGLEVVILTNHQMHGWFEKEAMGVGRNAFIARFAEPHIRDRIHMLYAVARAPRKRWRLRKGPVEEEVNIHAKVLIVDDVFLRIGSANLNNRSMGFDTECDIAIEAQTEAHRSAIRAVRARLIAEHWDTNEDAADAAAAQTHVWPQLEKLRGPARRVVPLPKEEPQATTSVVADLGDPERVVTAERFMNEVLGIKKYRRELKFAVGALIAAAILIAAAFLLKRLPFEDLIEQARASIEALRGSAWTVPAVVGAMIVGCILCFPIVLMIGTVIIMLGPVQGFICAVLGTLLGGVTNYFTGKLTGRNAMSKLLGKNQQRFERQLAKRGIITVALLRKVPIAPFTIVNMAMGASGISLRDFLVGTSLGMVPGIAAFAIVGDRLIEVFKHPTPLNISFVASAVFIWIGVVLGMQWALNRFGSRKDGAAASGP